jgi:hypothetical protein
LNAGADFPEFRSLLEHVDAATGIGEGQCRSNTTDTAADDQNWQVVALHGSPGIAGYFTSNRLTMTGVGSTAAGR